MRRPFGQDPRDLGEGGDRQGSGARGRQRGARYRGSSRTRWPSTSRLTSDAEKQLARLHEVRRGFTGRTIDRIIKVARTIADLLCQDDIDAGCIAEAAAYRALDSDLPLPAGLAPAAAAMPRGEDAP
jgi:hypothetical protein